jgi:hypothetical protein
MFLQGKSNGFVVLKTFFFFLNHYIQNCGGEEKVNLGIFHFLVQNKHKLVGGQPSYLSFR